MKTLFLEKRAGFCAYGLEYRQEFPEMQDESRTKKQLLNELSDLRRELVEMKNCAAEISQLKDSNEKFIKAFLQSAIPMTLTTIEEGRFVDVNEAFLKLMGMTRNEVIGNTTRSLGYITDEQRALAFNELQKNGRIDNMEIQVKTKAGELKYGLFNVIMMSVKKEKYLLAVLYDNTARRLAENALRESEEYAKSLFASSQIPLIVMDAGTAVITDCNEAAARIYGFATRGEVIGKNPVEMSAPIQYDGSDSATAVKKHIAACCNNGSAVFEWRSQRADGQIWEADVQLMLFHHRGKRLIQYKLQDITQRKLAEETLRQSEQEKSAILNAITELVTYLDLDLKVIRSNNAMLKQFNLRAEQVEGKYCYEVFQGLKKPCSACPVAKTMETGEPYAINDFSSLGKRWFMRSYPVKEGEKLVGVVETVIDVTESKMMEDALRESEEKYRNIFQNASVGIFHTLPEGKILQANPALAQMFGYESPEEMIAVVTNTGPHLYLDQEKRAGFIAAIMQSDDLVSAEFLFRRKDGTTMTAIMTAHKILKPDGTMYCLEGFVEDITERKLAEEALKMSEQQYRSLVEYSGNFILCVDEKGEYKFTNQLYASTFGKTPDYFIGKTFRDIYPPEHADKRFAITKRVFQTGASESQEMEIPLPDKTLYFYAQANPIKDDSGKVVQMLVHSTDITGRKKVENELARYRSQLEELVQQRTREVESRNISLQELNTALTVLLKKREEDKQALEETLAMNIRNMVFPYIELLKQGLLDANQRNRLQIIETLLQDISVPLMKNLRQFNLTPQEIKVAGLVRQGKSTKEIAVALGIARGSVDGHRKKIREKLGLNNKKANLQSYIENLE